MKEWIRWRRGSVKVGSVHGDVLASLLLWPVTSMDVSRRDEAERRRQMAAVTPRKCDLSWKFELR